MFVATSASVRPVRTAARDIGSDRKRSISPFFRSSASPSAVTKPPKRHRLDDDPGDQEVDVARAPGVEIAPPKT